MVDSAHVEIDASAEQRLIQLLTGRCDPRWHVDLHAYAWRLVGLVHEARDRPMVEFTMIVRRIVCEHSRPDHGDTQGKVARSLDRHVKRLIEAMEQVRRELSAEGHWSDAPVPPLMCG